MLFKDDLFDLGAEVRAIAEAFPTRTAVIEPVYKAGEWQLRSYSYAQLSHDADTIAAALLARGYHPEIRTVFMAPPSYEACATGIALSQIGATFIWIDPSVGYLNVGERLRRVRPEAFVGIPLAHAGRVAFGWGPRVLQKTICLQGRFPGATSFKTLAAHPHKHQAPPDVSPDAASHVLYTTGSTGPAKPAMYTQSQFSAVYRTAHRGWRFAEQTTPPIDMAAFPAFLFIGVSAGGTMVVPPINFVRETPATTNAKAVCEVINAAGVQSLFASPALLERLSNYAHQSGIPMPTLRRVIGGGAPITASLMEQLVEVIADEGEVWANYGATEALPSTEMGSVEVLHETGALTAAGHGICVGRPFPDIEVRAVIAVIPNSHQLSDFRQVSTGETGELIVRGPNISQAYFLDPQSTEKNKLYSGTGEVWHRLGDLGHLDDQGRVWVAGRASQAIQTATAWLLPIPIEAQFDAHPLIRRSGLATRTTRNGQPEPVLALEAIRRLSQVEKAQLLDEFRAFAANDPTLAQIRDFIFLDALPMDPRHNAKIERNKLSKMVSRS